MTTHHLAQVNLAYMRAAQDDPRLAGFVAQLDAINRLADASPGFVWRYISDTRLESEREFLDSRVLFNLSVWESLESLHSYAYKGAHGKVFGARRKWFDDWKDKVRTVSELGAGMPALALWWIPAGTRPTPHDSKDRLRLLAARGPGPAAFTFKQAFTPQGQRIKR